LSANFRRKGRRPQTTVGVRKLEWLPFREVPKYPQFLTKHACDRWTDRQTKLRLPRPR